MNPGNRQALRVEIYIVFFVVFELNLKIRKLMVRRHQVATQTPGGSTGQLPHREQWEIKNARPNFGYSTLGRASCEAAFTASLALSEFPTEQGVYARHSGGAFSKSSFVRYYSL